MYKASRWVKNCHIICLIAVSEAWVVQVVCCALIIDFFVHMLGHEVNMMALDFLQ